MKEALKLKFDELHHHGVKGQKWGVRRYQNKDGSLTPEGRSRYQMEKAAKTKGDVDSIINSLSKKDRELLMDGRKEYLSIEQGKNVVARFIKKCGKTPVAFFDISDEGDHLNAAIVTRSGEEYRGKGYASKCVQSGLAWYERNRHRFEDKRIVWWAKKENIGSQKTALRNGFVRDADYIKEWGADDDWQKYVYE